MSTLLDPRELADGRPADEATPAPPAGRGRASGCPTKTVCLARVSPVGGQMGRRGARIRVLVAAGRGPHRARSPGNAGPGTWIENPRGSSRPPALWTAARGAPPSRHAAAVQNPY
jgi:hypothetical protein